MSKVLVGIIGNDAARFHEFTASALRLETPEGSKVQMLIGGDWCGARNSLAKECLDGDYTHLWFMDDDHSFAPDLLMRLLKWDKPLITPICLSRVFPFAPVSYVTAPPELAHHGDIVPIDLANCPSSGLVELESGGCAGMLIAREVLEATREMSDQYDLEDKSWEMVPDRWFEYGDVSEDIMFCHKAKEAGFTLHADLEARLGHITTTIVIPSYTDEHGWTTGLRVGKDYDIRVKQTYDLIEDGRRVEDERSLDVYLSAPGEVPASSTDSGAQPPTGRVAGAENPVERIEIWLDAENRWWWRAVAENGEIVQQDSAFNEKTVTDVALSFYPGVSIHHIQREIDDSRSPIKYGPPVRLWNRGGQ
jgi:hypothetical protein